MKGGGFNHLLPFLDNHVVFPITIHHAIYSPGRHPTPPTCTSLMYVKRRQTHRVAIMEFKCKSFSPLRVFGSLTAGDIIERGSPRT